VEIWTDVPGMFSANPKDVPDARLLTRLDYYEAQEIATTGAKVLHPRSIKPCRDAGVPMAILDTERPELPGTSIDGSAAPVPGVKAISRRNGIVLVSMEGIGMWQQVGFLADVFNLFKKHGLSVDLIGSAETNVTVSLDPSENLVNTDVLAALSADLSQICKVKVIVPCAAITLVGRGMRSLLHKLSDVWATFGRERVHMISQSSNDLNLTFVIDEADADGLLPILHELIDSGAMPVEETEVFGPRWRDRRHRAPAWHAVVARPACAPAAAGRCRYAALCLPPADGARPRPRAGRDQADRPALLRDQGQQPPGHPAAAGSRGLRPECVSRRAEACVPAPAGAVAQRVLFTPSFCPRSEYEAAFALGVTVTVDNVEALQRWPDLFRNRELWLRVDLGRGEGHHAKVRTGGKESKFGLPIAASTSSCARPPIWAAAWSACMRTWAVAWKPRSTGA
jgi:diaminopimelate decarboxylase/aspartate kinase